MQDLKECVGMLSSFGLSTTQSRIYAALVRYGTMSVSKIAKRAILRREVVYRTLPSLEKLGMIEKTVTTPLKVKAMPADESLRHLIQQLKEETEKKTSALTQMVTSLNDFLNLKTETERDDPQFSLYSEKRAIFNKSAILLKNLHKELDFITSRSKLPSVLYHFDTILKDAINRGVNIRVITEIPEDEDGIPSFIETILNPGPSIKLRYLEGLRNHFMIIDGEKMLISTSTDLASAEVPALYTSSKSLINVFKKYFENIWTSALDWSTIHEGSKVEKVTQFIKHLNEPKPVMFIYENQESKFNVLCNYVKSGLENMEAALYVCSQANPQQIKNTMRQYDIDVDKYEGAQALNVLKYSDFYMRNGIFSIPNSIDLWKKYYNEARCNGYKALRVTTETACFFKHNCEEALVKYEKEIHKDLGIPMTGIWSYNIANFYGVPHLNQIYQQLIDTHGKLLFIGVDERLGKIEVRSS